MPVNQSKTKKRERKDSSDSSDEPMKAPESPGKWEIVPGSSQTRSVLRFLSTGFLNFVYYCSGNIPKSRCYLVSTSYPFHRLGRISSSLDSVIA